MNSQTSRKMEAIRKRSNYIRNLRKENKVCTTRHHHFVIPDCDWDGKPLKTRLLALGMKLLLTEFSCVNPVKKKNHQAI